MNPLHAGLRAITRWTLIPAFLLTAGTVASHAQITPVASRTTDISVFAGWQNLQPDYGRERNNGFMVGADITRYLGIHVDPSLEIRFSDTPGQNVSEKSYQGGFRVQTDFKRFHPYADILGGIATLNLPRVYGRPTYTHSTGGTYSFGGGIDYDVYRNFQVRVDYQQQNMYFNQGITLTPRPLSVGLTYRIPFRARTGS